DVSQLVSALHDSGSSDFSLGRPAADDFARLGFVPVDARTTAGRRSQTVSLSLEEYTNDAALAAVCRRLNDQSAHCQKAGETSLRFDTLFDSESGHFRPKRSDGRWLEPFSPIAWGGHFTEGSAWHWRVSPGLHAPLSLQRLFGGAESFGSVLRAFITEEPKATWKAYGMKIHEVTEMELLAKRLGTGQFALTNEPLHHALHLFPWADEQTQNEMFAHLMRLVPRTFEAGPSWASEIGAYIGDEDNGQMSAWYVLACLGVYPAQPFAPWLVRGPPLVESATLRVDGAEVTLRATEHVSTAAQVSNDADFANEVSDGSRRFLLPLDLFLGRNNLSGSERNKEIRISVTPG
ncbi:MAG: hypothetical protein MHM6MM_008315, partial [Cercozoa sp. M6MM]